jgi:hypothetical protein
MKTNANENQTSTILTMNKPLTNLKMDEITAI